MKKLMSRYPDYLIEPADVRGQIFLGKAFTATGFGSGVYTTARPSAV